MAFIRKVKIGITISFMMILCLSVSKPAFAHVDDPWTKLGRGLTNIVTSPVEILRQQQIMMKNYDNVTAFFGGLGKGIVWTFMRFGAGVAEALTFPFPWPDTNYKPFIDPPTLFDKSFNWS